jgi:hypothetical protein
VGVARWVAKYVIGLVLHFYDLTYDVIQRFATKPSSGLAVELSSLKKPEKPIT